MPHVDDYHSYGHSYGGYPQYPGYGRTTYDNSESETPSNYYDLPHVDDYHSYGHGYGGYAYPSANALMDNDTLDNGSKKKKKSKNGKKKNKSKKEYDPHELIVHFQNNLQPEHNGPYGLPTNSEYSQPKNHDFYYQQ